MFKRLNKKGSASLTVVLSAPIILLLICLAIDYLRIQTVKNDTQRIIDDATLTAAMDSRPSGEDVYIDEDGFIVTKDDTSVTTTTTLACEITKANMEKALKQINANIYVEYTDNISLSTDESHPILEITNISSARQAKNGVAYIQVKGYVPGLLSNIFTGDTMFYFPYVAESYSYCSKTQTS